MVEGASEFMQAAKLAVSGFVGALIASFFHRDELANRRDFVMFFISGWACAYFLTGLVASHFSIHPDNYGAVGFLLGAFGGSLISAVIRGIRAADLWGFIKQRFGGGA